MNQTAFTNIGERIDRIVATDIGSRGVIDTLYRVARDRQGKPLCLAAAEMLLSQAVKGEPILIATGWPDRPGVSVSIAESDGPVGAAALARALHRATGAIPVILIEEQLIPAMRAILQAAGLRVQSVDECRTASDYRAPVHAGAILPLPVDSEQAKASADSFFRQYTPTSVISIEKGGQNSRGQISTSLGADTTDSHGKADYYMHAARAAGIPTIGIGDGGNELGMGAIQADIRRLLRHGDQFAPAFEVDVLVAVAVSNWGAYGIAACIAALSHNVEHFHDARVEEAMLRAAAGAGLIDGITGWVEPSVDGISLPAQAAVVELLSTIVRLGLKPNRSQSPLL
ncbi:MAG: glutamate cyclase domain-containing protein [Pseudaminobacter sp.]